MSQHTRNLALTATLLGFLMSGAGGALTPKQPGGELSQKEFFKPELRISNANRPLAEILGSLPNRQAWQSFLAANPAQAFIDPRSGAATNLVGAFPLIPGPGAGNEVTLEELAARIGRPVQAVDAAVVGDAVLAFVRAQAQVLGVDTLQLGTMRSVQVTPQLWQVSIPQEYMGIPVRYGRLAASISHGNLVVVGTESWGNVGDLSIVPALSAETAMAAGFDYVGGRSRSDEIRREPRLEVLPVAPQEYQQGEGFVGPVGAGYRHRLVWTFAFQRASEGGLWEVVVDAHDGQVLAFEDINQYVNRSVTGGVYPLTDTEICPNAATCGTLQSGWPMPFTNTGLAAPNDFTNSAGIFDYLSGTVTTTLTGKYLKITDTCGAVSKSSPGYVNLGGVNGQHDCTAAAGSAGNTSSARSAYYELNRIAEQARGWLPTNTWLQGQLNANVNLNQTCNAYWDFVSVNFFKSGGGCRNTGEIASVFDHEWGHGLDDNDAAGTLSNSSEAYADIAAIFRLQTSCVGHGFFQTIDFGCGTTSDGTGFNTDEAQTGSAHCDLDCSGVRDADWDKHAGHAPDTPLGFVCTSCVTGSGPCGRQVHCAAAPVRQAAWDLVARDLQAAPFSYSSQTAFIVGNKVFYQGSGNVGSWHSCTCGGTADGCGATNGYMQWLTADDDNGNLSDGTPHMTAIYNAFNRHGIACASPTPMNSGCAGGPTAATALSVTPGTYSAGLTWTSVAGASKYWVFRSEGHAGCNFGKTKIAETASLSYTDTQLAAGRDYSYNVVAAASNAACYGAASNCVTVTVQGAETSCQTLTLAHTGSGSDPTASPTNSTGCPSGQYHPGELIQLTAAASPGYQVGNWTGTDADASSAAVNSVTMQASSQTATVHYFQAVVVAAFDFETDPGLALTGLWHRTAACTAASSGHSLPMALYYGIDAQCNYNNGVTNSGTATLPVINLAAEQAPIQLSFKYYLSTEDFSTFDAATVERSVGGGSYQTVASNHPTGSMVTLDDPSGSWKTVSGIDLSAAAGSTVQLRFRFDTVDDIANSFPGFYVDDVQIVALHDCVFANQNLTLSNQTVTTVQVFEACQTITAGTNFVVAATGDATFHAVQRVKLDPGFKVLAGGKLKVQVP